jgi:hypothetical protein
MIHALMDYVAANLTGRAAAETAALPWPARRRRAQELAITYGRGR